MILSIEQAIRKLEGKLPGRGRRPLSFLKYNTPPSGRSLGCKVIFFIFAEGAKTPSVVAKTVRAQRDADVIRSGHASVMRLNEIVRGSEFEARFPQMLALEEHGNGAEIFTIETACPGRKMSANDDPQKALDFYTSFSKLVYDHVRTNGSGAESSAVSLDFEYAAKLIQGFNCTNETREAMIRYARETLKDGISLPPMPQHGDLTIDNILVDGERINIIDCDTFGRISVPGFDIFHFMRRSRMSDLVGHLERYFREVGITCVPDKRLLFIYFLHELYIKKDYILADKPARAVMDQFESLNQP